MRMIEHYKPESFAVYSHEIKAPMGMALSAVEMLESKVLNEAAINDSSIKDLFNIATTNIYKSLRIANNFIDADRIMKSKLLLKVKPHNISLIIKRNIDTAKKFLTIRDATIVVESKGPRACFANVDECAVDRIFLNLISNSIKHLPSKNGKLLIKLDVESDFFVFSVTDNGSGIAKENLENIFLPYWHDTGTGTPDRDSTGLGLYIAKSLVEIQRGSISVQSEPHMQTTFTVKLPLNARYESDMQIMSDYDVYSDSEKHAMAMRELLGSQ